MLFRVEVFIYFLTIAEYRETNFINLHTTLLSMFSKITKLELNGFKIFLQWNKFHKWNLSQLILKTYKSGVSLKWKEGERV